MRQMRGSAAYESLAEFRYQLRRFLRFSEQAAAAAGLEPQQHQLMLALKGMPMGVRPGISKLAERLQIKHHSAVELVDRLCSAGYVRRQRAGDDRRQVLLGLTAKGGRVLSRLARDHQAELSKRGPALILALRRVITNSGKERPLMAQPQKKTDGKSRRRQQRAAH